MSSQNPRTVIVLAAGEGKRMRSSLPKVLHPLLGRSLLGHVLAAVGELEADRTLVVVGNGADQVSAHLAEIAPKAVPVRQEELRGTGHAVRTALGTVPEVSGTVLVVNGDMPLLRGETLREFADSHERDGAVASLLSARVADPTGLGRILRDADGRFTGIIEHRDASPAQREIDEINVGVYAFDAATLRAKLAHLTADNAQGEQYLTDVLGLLVAEGLPVAVRPTTAEEALGCNDRVELATARATLRDRINRHWQLAGVTIIDPATTWIDVTVSIGQDAVIEPNTHLRGATTLGEAACVGPDVTLIDTQVGAGATVLRAHAVSAEIGPEAVVGPYAYLRPGTRLHRRVKIGTYVELKQAEVGEGAKVPHLTYVGDATIGPEANIGAGTVFVNYDGAAKHHTQVGRAAFVGSNSSLVAPVTVGDGAYVAAGSAITRDVGPGELAVTRTQQRNLPGWVVRRRAGTKSARAAEAAGETTGQAPTEAGESTPSESAPREVPSPHGG